MRAAGKGLSLVARIVLAVAVLVFLIIALGVLLLLLGANQGNVLVQLVNDAANFLAAPFNGLFSMSTRKLTTGVNWAIAAFVYLIVGALIAGLLRRMGGRRR